VRIDITFRSEEGDRVTERRIEVEQESIDQSTLELLLRLAEQGTPPANYLGPTEKPYHQSGLAYYPDSDSIIRLGASYIRQADSSQRTHLLTKLAEAFEYRQPTKFDAAARTLEALLRLGAQHGNMPEV